MTLTPSRLSRLIDAAFTKTKNQREARLKFMSQYVGRFYRYSSSRPTLDEASKASPINLIFSAVTTLIPNLVFNDPRARVSTDVLAYRNYADLLAEAVTMVCKRSRFRETLRLTVSDAIFMAGFIKTGLAVGEQVIEFGDGVDVNLTEPFIERVSPDDMILDPAARHWDEQAFVGNRFRADVDKLIEIGYGDPDKLNQLAYELSYKSNLDKVEGITQPPMPDEPRRYVDLAEIWIPAENRVVTLPCKPGATFTEFIVDREYTGPPRGQYHMLGFVEAPDNLLPIAPAGIWYDLHILGNRIARKLARQAERNKRILAYEDEAEEDAEAVADANDGETVRVQSVDRIREIEFGGASERAYEWMNWIKTTFGDQSGVVEHLRGVDAAAPTLGQEQIIQANTSVRIGDMQNLVYAFAGKAMSDIGFYLHTDPLIELPLVRRVNGVEVQDYFTPDARVGEWYEYNLSVEPYSMARVDASTAIRRKLEFATTVVPAAVAAQTQLGPGFKIGPYLARLAREVGIEDADEWLSMPEIEAWIRQKMELAALTGRSGKADNYAPRSLPSDILSPPPINPAQPLPSATAPVGGISPETEQAQAQQLASKESQVSTKTMALARGAV